MFVCKPILKIFAAHFRTKGMLNHDNICMRVIHNVVIQEKLPSKRHRIRSSGSLRWSFRTYRSGQTQHTQIRLLTAPRGAVWSGSTLSAIPSASFGCVITINFRVSEILWFLTVTAQHYGPFSRVTVEEKFIPWQRIHPGLWHLVSAVAGRIPTDFCSSLNPHLLPRASWPRTSIHIGRVMVYVVRWVNLGH